MGNRRFLSDLFEGLAVPFPERRGTERCTVVGGRSPFPIYREGTGTIYGVAFGIVGSGGSGAFVGAGRRSLALSERSELASDGREQRRQPRCLCW